MIWLLRFFAAADPAPVWMRVLTVGIALYAGVIAAMAPAEIDEALAVLVLWQMLAASTGFTRPALAGHFDPALVRARRLAMGAAHLVYATLPLLMAWLLVALVEAVVHRRWPFAFEAGRLSAFALVSAAAWAWSLAAPRLTVGALWLAGLVVGAATRVGADQYAAMAARADGSLVQMVHASLMAAACPFLMIGTHVPARREVTLFLLLCSAITVAAGLRFIARRNYALESPS